MFLAFATFSYYFYHVLGFDVLTELTVSIITFVLLVIRAVCLPHEVLIMKDVLRILVHLAVVSGESIRNLVSSNAARGVTERIVALTGHSKHNLDYFAIRFKDENDAVIPKMHPFSLVSKCIQRFLGEDESFFEVQAEVVAMRIILWNLSGGGV